MQAKHETPRGRSKLRTDFVAQALITMFLIVGSGCIAPVDEGGAEWAQDAGATQVESVDKSLPSLEALTGISNEAAKRTNYAGTFRCTPCNKTNCAMTNLNKSVSIDLKLNTSTGTKVPLKLSTCGQIKELLNLRGANPTQCGAIRSVTLAASDPCGCAPSAAPANECPADPIAPGVCPALCGSGKVMGDPGMIIQSGILDGSECGDAKKSNYAGAFENVCARARESVQAWCRCKTRSSPALKPCILQRGDCTPGVDVCCNSKACTKNAYGQFKCPTG